MTEKTEASGEVSDVLNGYAEIGKFMGCTERQAEWRCTNGGVPTFKIGRSVCARRSTLRRWMDEQEAAAKGAGK